MDETVGGGGGLGGGSRAWASHAPTFGPGGHWAGMVAERQGLGRGRATPLRSDLGGIGQGWWR